MVGMSVHAGEEKLWEMFGKRDLGASVKPHNLPPLLNRQHSYAHTWVQVREEGYRRPTSKVRNQVARPTERVKTQVQHTALEHQVSVLPFTEHRTCPGSHNPLWRSSRK